jgi:hypothetical protein
VKRVMILLLITSGAALVIPAANASALPAYFECHKGTVGSGKYADKLCEEEAAPGKGKYELQEGVGKGKPFSGSGGGMTLKAPAIGGVWTCSSSKESGVVGSPTSLEEVVITFKGCGALGKKCSSEGSLPGEIKTQALAGTLGYISMSPLSAGIALEEQGSGWMSFNCEGLQWNVSGALIGSVSGNINQINKKTSDSYEMTGEGAPAVRKFEGGPTQVLESVVNGAGPFETAIATHVSVTGEPLEIKA